MPIMSEKARDVRNRYLRDWRKKNKSRVKQYNKNYWEKKAKEVTGEKKASDK